MRDRERERYLSSPPVFFLRSKFVRAFSFPPNFFDFRVSYFRVSKKERTRKLPPPPPFFFLLPSLLLRERERVRERRAFLSSLSSVILDDDDDEDEEEEEDVVFFFSNPSAATFLCVERAHTNFDCHPKVPELEKDIIIITPRCFVVVSNASRPRFPPPVGDAWLGRTCALGE